MRFTEYLAEDEQIRTKKRPKKTLHFHDYQLWVHDIVHRFPNVEPIEFEDEEVVAVDSDNPTMCYGKWDKSTQRGVAFNQSRPLSITTHRK